VKRDAILVSPLYSGIQGGVHMKPKMKPLGEKVLIRRLEEPEQKVGGIIIPDTAKEKPQQGEVIAVGPGRVDKEGKRVPIEVKKGQKVLFGKYSGTEISIGDQEYLFVDSDDIMAILE
jgi:chaperonin GroES